MAAKAEALAESEGRTLSDLFLQAFRSYQAAAFDRWWKELDEDTTRNPHGYTEEDIPRLIKEVRAEMSAEEEARNSAKAS
jgi:hypothetical protein